MKVPRSALILLVPVLALAAGPDASMPGVGDAMNKQANPCVDFYQYACGAWISSHPTPADKARWGRFDELQERNEAVLQDILQGAAVKRTGRAAIDQKIGDAYASCMDEAGIEKKGIAPLRADLERIGALTRDDLMDEIARMHAMGILVVFGFGAAPDFKDSSRTIASMAQGGLSLPDRDYYLNSDAKSVALREKFVAHVARMFQLLGESSGAAQERANAVLAFETVIAKASMDRVTRRDPTKLYHPTSRTELEAINPEIPWDSYFRIIGVPAFTTVNISQPDFFKAVAAELPAQPVPAWQAYFTYHLLHARAEQLPAAFDKENFDFYSRTLGGTPQQRPRAKRCVAAVDTQLGDLLGQKYAELAFGGASKQQITQMVDALEKALDQDIRALPWMSDVTKKEALAKLRAITNNVGTPKKYRDYGAVTVAPDDFVGNATRAARAQRARDLEKIGKPTDRTEWRMTTPTVNAFYSPLNNSINFPAGILQGAFFDARRDTALNFGAIGAVIGHELTHGFDDAGRKFDGNGNLRDWWTPQDGQEFEKRVACVANEYSNFSPLEDVKLNGKLTLGENVADHGGVRIALMAMLDTLKGKLEKVDGFTPEQRFFLGFAQVWCQNTRPEEERRRAQIDPHSPGRFRVNGTFQNMPEFQKAFSCQTGQPMVSANACHVW